MFDLKTPGDGMPAPQLELSCTRGAAAPEGLRDDVRALLSLPDAVKHQFERVLVPYLAGTPNEEQQAWLQQLCERAHIEPTELVGPIRGSRFLVASAARTAQTRETFTDDLARLDDDPRAIRELIEILLPIFERVSPVIRAEIVERTVAEHGKLVEAAHWRVDKIVNSEHGDGINTPVAVLTFDYREGSRQERITLHLLPEQLHSLKVACQQMLPDAGGDDRS